MNHCTVTKFTVSINFGVFTDQPLEESVPSENIMVLSHGAALKQLYTHIHKTLGCHLPADPDILNKISPNTGISEYIVR